MLGLFLNGFMMGGMVGCGFGGVIGLIYAIQYRSFWTFPVVMVSTGASFGFFMGIGALFRGGEGSNEIYEHR